jgi:hypothetical protein
MEPDKIKIKLLGGDTFLCDLMGDASNAKTYLKWYYNYLRVIVEKKSGVKLLACTETLERALEDLKKPSKVPKRKSTDQAAERKLELAACKLKSDAAYIEHSKAIGVHYDLFRQLLADKPQVQWDRIVEDVHNKDPWTGLDGVKHNGLHMKTAKSLEDCTMFHKITVFSVDAAEGQKACMMGSLKKPRQLTIRNHISRCEELNGYIGHLPTLRDSQLAVASTEKGNVPFNEATLASIILSTCPTDWRNQYEMNHKTQDHSGINEINAPQSREHQEGLRRKRRQESQDHQGLGWHSPQESGNCAQETWEGRRFWRTSPQEGTLRQVLQVV